MLPYTCNSSTTIEFPLEEWNLSCKLLHHPSRKMQSILHQLPTNSSELLWEWKPLTQIKWIQQCIHTIQDPILNIWCLFAKSLHFRGLALKVHGKAPEHLLHLWGLRSVQGKSRMQWKPWSACCSCSRFPSILVPCCAEMPDLMERQWIDSAWRPLSTKISTQTKQQNWFLVAPGWEGMRWNEGTNRNDTQRKVDESSFPTY